MPFTTSEILADGAAAPLRSRRLQVGEKFFVPLSVLIAALLTVSVVALSALGSMHRQTTGLYQDDLVAIQISHEALTGLDDINLAALQLIPTDDPAELMRQERVLDDRLLPVARVALDRLRVVQRAQGASNAGLDRVGAALDTFTALRGSGAYDRRGSDATQLVFDAGLARQTNALFASMTSPIDQISARNADEAAHAKAQSNTDYRTTRSRLLVIVGAGLLLSLLSLLWLIRNVVPRLRRYAQFATEVAAGTSHRTLALTGNDELTQLGRALNEMVLSRQHDQARHAAQSEFVETLQVTDSESEAHTLLQTHLARRVTPASSITVLSRNNSADRLEPATALPAQSALLNGLVGAAPRSCLAVRLARTHTATTDGAPLLSCQVCSGLDRFTTCEPLIVSGEVIGSVVLGHDVALQPVQLDTIKESVFQAAPLLGNLRSLALAQYRANNDFLTGLANKRATEDTLKRMVAQANRSLNPLAAVMVDLDHFKKVNDLHGHGVGDEALAAVGAALADSIRAGDYAGRYGGEEFLLLLPNTDSAGAANVAEKARTAITEISIAALQGPLTASFGVASLPSDSCDAQGLIRQADLALYRAKSQGRNRVIQARHTDIASPQEDATATVP